ncbi:hypothetical protein [Planctobacterium marinum]|uniref:hypothetical protein n=1 Tax=Planctobacterium marinum TaxID=1631968 RepID=UPI001E32BF4C|nr:hypothetical protein [Planctobacterium marinum]MCC2604947.1 hypothetical protein [Planctobacterium marinum]
MKPTDKHIFDDPNKVKRLLKVFYVGCAMLLLLDFVLHRHTEHPWEWLPGFYPLYGFVGCVVLVLVAKWMRLAVMRDEDYYETSDKQNEGKEHHVGD